jgi:integration host factor subunit alpha
MTLTKAKMIGSVADANGFDYDKASVCVETLIEIMKRSLESGDDVLVSGFGKFCVKQKGARRGRNPATNKELLLEPRRIVTFKCSKKLREQVDR